LSDVCTEDLVSARVGGDSRSDETDLFRPVPVSGFDSFMKDECFAAGWRLSVLKCDPTLELQSIRAFVSVILGFVLPFGSQRNSLMNFVRAKKCV